MSSILYYSVRCIHAKLISTSLRTAAVGRPSALTEAISIAHHDEVKLKENNTCLSSLINSRLLNLRLILSYITVDHPDTIVILLLIVCYLSILAILFFIIHFRIVTVTSFKVYPQIDRKAVGRSDFTIRLTRRGGRRLSTTRRGTMQL